MFAKFSYINYKGIFAKIILMDRNFTNVTYNNSIMSPTRTYSLMLIIDMLKKFMENSFLILAIL